MGKVEVTWDEYDQFGFSLDLQKKRKLAYPALEGRRRRRDATDAALRGRVVGLGQGAAAGHRDHPLLGREVLRVAVGEDRQEGTGCRPRRSGSTLRGPERRPPTPSARTRRQLGEYAWYTANSEEQPHVGRQKKPNAWGLHDMHGNVAEWTADALRRGILQEGGATSAAPFNDGGEALYPHVVRGGSWDDDAGPSAQRRAALIRREVEPARSPEPEEQVVAHRRDVCRLPGGARRPSDGRTRLQTTAEARSALRGYDSAFDGATRMSSNDDTLDATSPARFPPHDHGGRRRRHARLDGATSLERLPPEATRSGSA